MAGNSQRRGAMRKTGTKKGPTVGSGGQRRQGLEGRGPTPKAEDRQKHPAARRARAKERAAGGRPGGQRRSSASLDYLVGRNPVVEGLRADIPATALYVLTGIDMDDRIREALRIATGRRIPLMEASRLDLDRMTDGALHQGIALRIPAYEYADAVDIAGGCDLLVALDGVTDPRNLGAVARSAAAFGAGGVVVPERRAAGVTSGAWKASAGALARVPVARTVNLTRALKGYQKQGFTVIGLAADGETALGDLSADLLAGPVVLVVGGEESGMSRLVRETCDIVASIPMTADTESLNAGVAAGIALYALSVARG